MRVRCPTKRISCLKPGKTVRFGHFRRSSDGKRVQRYKCTSCGRYFSQATFSPLIHQKKRHLNQKVFELLAALASQRSVARFLRIHPITVARKLRFLGARARFHNLRERNNYRQVLELQFDDLETFEHTKLKPLSVPLAVEKHSRFILGFEVARMPTKGLLAKKSVKKYGPRIDERQGARARLFRRIKHTIAPQAIIESDSNPHYPEIIRAHFPNCHHQTHKGRRGCIVGQGELKKIGFDPLFSLNHTCAMYRANVNRLIRKTWCTTKKIQPLIDHLEIYVKFHNQKVLRRT